MNNWQEWRAGTIPTQQSSVFEFTSVTQDVSGVTLTWQSGAGRVFVLQRGTNLRGSPLFSPVQSNIVGQAGLTSFTDTTATNRRVFIYRVAVQ
jgi:hypothetical protein